MAKQIRLATVKATGKRFIVQQINFKTDRVHCWGSVSWVGDRASTRHQASKVFDLDDVSLASVTQTSSLVVELFKEYFEELEAANFVVAVTGKKNQVVWVKTAL